MANLFKKTTQQVNPRTGKTMKRRSRKWWGRYRDAFGRDRRVPLAADKMAAQSMLNQLVQKVEREKAGLVDATDEQRKRPLKDHLGEFEAYLRNKGVTQKQVKTAVNQIRKMMSAGNWTMISDISASGALEFLGSLREADKSVQTYNHYLKSAKQFTRWLVRDRRTVSDPLAHLSKLNVSIDRRHDRRALSAEEFQRLVEAARVGDPIETISGPDRAMMYILAAWTGFRKGEIGSLTRSSFNLQSDPPTATVQACYSKRKREDTQILHPILAELIRQLLAGKPELGPSDVLFPVSGRAPGSKERKTHKMMQRDLQAAREKWIREATNPEDAAAREESDFLAYCSESGLFADFHSTRHLFITSLERARVSPKMAQTLARHSDVRLTLGVYTHVGLHDQTAAIQSLPVPPELNQAINASTASAAKATGTDDPRAPAPSQKSGQKVVPTMVPSGAKNGANESASKGHEIASNCLAVRPDLQRSDGKSVDANAADQGTYCIRKEQSAAVCSERKKAQKQVSPAGFEPVTFGLEGRRLALGLTRDGESKWRYNLPVGAFGSQVRFVTSAPLLDADASHWLIAAADESCISSAERAG